MSYNENNKYQTKHNKNRHYNAISSPNITNISINNTETKDKDIIRKCNKKLSMLSLHDNSPNNNSLSNNIKHENKIFKVNKQLTYMNRMMYIVNLYKKQQQDKQKVFITPNGTFSVANSARDDNHDKHIRLDFLKIKLRLIKTLIKIRLAVEFFIIMISIFKKNFHIILLKNGLIINLLIICLVQINHPF